MEQVEDFFSQKDPERLNLIELQLTYRCNIRCRYCFNPHHRRVDELSLDEWKRVVQEARSLGASACLINGGEPLLGDVIEVAGYAHSLGITTGLATNGLLLNEESLRALSASLDVLQISIHPWRYLDDVSEGLGEFHGKVKLFKEFGGRQAIFNITLFRGLASRLSELLHQIAELPGNYLDAVGIQAAIPYGQGYLNPDSIPSLEECETASSVIEQCRSLFSGPRLQNSVSNYFKVKPNTWGVHGAIVNPEGYVYPMIEGSDSLAILFQEYQFDNIRTMSLRSIWKDSEVMNLFRGTHWLQEPCRTCAIMDECRGGSRLNAYLLAGDIRKADPFCVLSPDHETMMARYSSTR